jgi:cation:H+ antiporter
MENSIVLVWLEFAACLAVIGIAGAKLTVYGDIIAEKTGLSGNWIGFILLATVTSLPELVNGISSVTIADAPEIAVGDILGSCVFNLSILVVLDFLLRGEPLYARAARGHVLSSGFGIILIGFTGFSILMTSDGLNMAFGHAGIYSYVIIVLYLLAARTVFRYEMQHNNPPGGIESLRYPETTLGQAVARFCIAALFVVADGVFLPFVAKEIAVQMDWHQSFVGTLFVAGATSVPELVVCLSALRLGAVDMAVGNLLGSNLFDIVILAIDDLLYAPGPLFSAVSPIHALSAFSAVMMTGAVIAGLIYRPKTRVLRAVGWVSLFLFFIYLMNSYALFLHSR